MQTIEDVTLEETPNGLVLDILTDDGDRLQAILPGWAADYLSTILSEVDPN